MNKAMIRVPAINLSEIVVILKTEGGAEVGLMTRKLFKDTKVFNSWNKCMRILEFEIAPVLAKGEDISKVKNSLHILIAEGKVLTDAFTNVGSFIPGPIGITCSLIRAMVFFCEGNIPMGLLELLGCIPGAKIGIKGGSKVMGKVGERMMVALKQNKELGKYCSSTQLLLSKFNGFNSTFITAKLEEIRKVAGQSMQVTKPKLLDITLGSRIPAKYDVKDFGSLLIKRGFVILFMLTISISFCAQSPSDIQTYINRYKKIALEHERQYGIPASITLAQGILESGAGKSDLTRKTNNHFGIKKGTDWNGPLYYAWDDDPKKSPFRVYASAEESYKDHAYFLKNNSRYSNLFSISIYDYRGWANGLQRAGYATSPTYAKALIGYIDTYRLYSINGGIKLRPGKTITITRTITREELVERKDIQIEESEETEEQNSVESTMGKFMVQINGVRCTILYPGETLASIALKYNIPKRNLLEYNEIVMEANLNEGDVVFLAKKKKKYEGAQDFYRVKEGETLYDVSQCFGIRLASLAKMNHKDSFSTLYNGEKLRLK